MTGSMEPEEVRRSMLQLSWILEHLSACGDASPPALLSAWEQQAMEALSASRSRSTESGDGSTSGTARSSRRGSWEQLQLWREPGLLRALLLPPDPVDAHEAPEAPERP